MKSWLSKPGLTSSGESKRFLRGICAELRALADTRRLKTP
jgi:hypothetical protein